LDNYIFGAGAVVLQPIVKGVQSQLTLCQER
jgi:hypothetical protein